jgi:tetraacyldisaccharide 4'-kinase
VALEQRLNRAWYGKPKSLLLLLPLAYLYRLIAAVRRSLIRPQSCGVPLIVIGNISVGGSGKTPVVLAVAEYCQGLGYKVGIVSRGYGGNAPIYPYLVTAKSTPVEAGDEPFFNVPAQWLAVGGGARSRGGSKIACRAACLRSHY